MKNATIHHYLASTYSDMAFTHNYIMTFAYCGIVYAVFMPNTNKDALVNITKVSKASRGNGMALRFRPTNSDKQYLISMGAEVLCSVEYFNELYKASKYNRGEIAEMLVTEQLFCQKWEKDSVPFTMGGDIEDNGVAWQHKHEGATFCNEKSLRNLA